jgi:hypothetical protein
MVNPQSQLSLYEEQIRIACECHAIFVERCGSAEIVTGIRALLSGYLTKK